MSFSSPTDIQQLKNRVREIDQSLANNLEEEYVILYPPVVERLKKVGIEPIR